MWTCHSDSAFCQITSVLIYLRTSERHLILLRLWVICLLMLMNVQCWCWSERHFDSNGQAIGRSSRDAGHWHSQVHRGSASSANVHGPNLGTTCVKFVAVIISVLLCDRFNRSHCAWVLTVRLVRTFNYTVFRKKTPTHVSGAIPIIPCETYMRHICDNIYASCVWHI